MHLDQPNLNESEHHCFIHISLLDNILIDRHQILKRFCYWFTVFLVICIFTIFNFIGDDRLVSTNYTTLYAADNSRKLQTVSQCLTYCSVNSSCLSVSFNPITSTCYTAGNTDVILLEDTELGYPVYMKSSEMSQANVYAETSGLAMGAYISCTFYHNRNNFHIKKSPFARCKWKQYPEV